jgi:hypothetical protein
VNELWLDFILGVLASPILFVKWLLRLQRRWRFWHMAYTTGIICTSCRSRISLTGIWSCGTCRYTYRGHLMRACPICGSLPRMARCYECGVTTKLPEP